MDINATEKILEHIQQALAALVKVNAEIQVIKADPMLSKAEKVQWLANLGTRCEDRCDYLFAQLDAICAEKEKIAKIITTAKLRLCVAFYIEPDEDTVAA